MIKEILLIGFGGGIGSIFRYLISRVSFKLFPFVFPIGTFIVNILGCFLIGVLFGFSFKYDWFAGWGRSLLIIGFCGGFTTFSTFSIETLNMYQNGNFFILFLYITGSIFLGLVAVWAGLFLTK